MNIMEILKTSLTQDNLSAEQIVDLLEQDILVYDDSNEDDDNDYWLTRFQVIHGRPYLGVGVMEK